MRTPRPANDEARPSRWELSRLAAAERFLARNPIPLVADYDGPVVSGGDADEETSAPSLR